MCGSHRGRRLRAFRPEGLLSQRGLVESSATWLAMPSRDEELSAVAAAAPAGKAPCGRDCVGLLCSCAAWLRAVMVMQVPPPPLKPQAPDAVDGEIAQHLN